MSNRLSKTEYLATYMIIITLAGSIGGFFLGANVMKSKMESQIAMAAEQEKEIAQQTELMKEKKLYKEQDFVTFYYNEYLPLKEFRSDHFQYASSLLGKTKAEQLSLSKEMRQKVASKMEEVKKGLEPTSSPLLLEAKEEYLQSLQAYQAGLDQTLDNVTGASFNAGDIASLKHLQDFKRQWLQAQSSMYKAFSVWEEMYVTKQPGLATGSSNLSTNQWQSLPVHARNYAMAAQLQKMQVLSNFNPEDVTARIDSVITDGKATQIGWTNISFAFNAVLATDSVRAGDFQKLKNKLYRNVQSPQIPLFSE